jgi:hypothetical protein
MKKHLILLTMLVIVSLTLLLSFSGCDKKEDTVAPEELAPPSNLNALSRDGGVTIYWTHSSSQGADFFVGYQIKVKRGLTLVDSVQVGKNTSSYPKDGLTNGETYTFEVRSVDDDNDVSVPATIAWGPTRRFTPARIYEFDSPNPSGLQFSTGSVFSFTSSTPDNRGVIDLWIDGRNGETPLLKSPDDEDFSSSGWRRTLLVETNANDLNSQVDVPAIVAFRFTPGLTIVANKVYFARTADGKYVRFQVSALQGTAPNRYVDVTIAYNSGTGAWAKGN